MPQRNLGLPPVLEVAEGWIMARLLGLATLFVLVTVGPPGAAAQMVVSLGLGDTYARTVEYVYPYGIQYVYPCDDPYLLVPHPCGPGSLYYPHPRGFIFGHGRAFGRYYGRYFEGRSETIRGYTLPGRRSGYR